MDQVLARLSMQGLATQGRQEVRFVHGMSRFVIESLCLRGGRGDKGSVYRRFWQPLLRVWLRIHPSICSRAMC